jgi:hypothetical protein
MPRTHWSANQHGVRQWTIGGRRGGTLRNPRAVLAIAIPLALAAGAAAVAMSAKDGAVRPELAASVSALRHHRPPQLPMPPAGPAAGTDCGITVPANPLSARGLATPYLLSGPGCTMTDPGTRAFVQATIINPRTGKLSVYEPLVIDRGTQPAVAPVRPTLPRGAVVTIDFGFNGDNLTQVATGGGARFRGGLMRPFYRVRGNSLRAGRCVNGLPGSIFGQVSYCNATAFFTAAHTAIAAGRLKIPALGTGTDGQRCPTVRSFAMVDQDQSDNVTSRYLLTGNGQLAQDNAANAVNLQSRGVTVVTNGSDDGLLDAYLDPAVGCAPFTARDLSNPGMNGTSQALNELQAAASQQPPIALVPVNDPMTEVGGDFNIAKTNLYRAGVGQPPLAAGTDPRANARQYCTDLLNTQVASLQIDEAGFVNGPAPDPGVGDNLFTFLAARLSGSFDNLGCASFGMANPVRLTTDENGVATGATFGNPSATSSTAQPSAPPSGTASGTASPTPSWTASGGSPAPLPSAPTAPAAAPESATPGRSASP